LEQKKSADERRAWLARELANLSAAGWRVEAQSDFHATVVKKQVLGLERRQTVDVDEWGNVIAGAVAERGGQRAKRYAVIGGGIALAAFVVIAIVGVIVGGNDEKSESPSSMAREAGAGAAEESATGVVTGKIGGKFDRDCLACSDLKRYIATSDVWCGWRGDAVIVNVRMTNRSVEHVTVHWHPSYVIRGGAEHGAGLGSVQDDGFEAGQSRVLVAEQHPEGVAPGSAIGECKPSFFLIESG
jgi:hypothetical protein